MAENLGIHTAQLENHLENLNTTVNETSEGMKNASMSAEDWRNCVVNTVSNVTVLIGGLESLKSSYETLNEKIKEGSLSLGDFIAIMSSFGASASIIVGSLRDLSGMIFALGGVTDEALAGTNALGGLLSKLGFTSVAQGISKLVPWLAALTAAIAAVSWVIDKLIVTEKEAEENIDKATQAYLDQKKAVAELNNELESIQARIDELNNQDTLTFIEEAELNRLRQTYAYLEGSKKIAEELEKADQKEQAETILKDFSTSHKDLLNPLEIKQSKILIGQDWYKTGEFKKDSFTSPEEFWNSLTEEQKKNDKIVQFKNDWEEEKRQERLQWLRDHTEELKKAEEEYQYVLDAINSGAINVSDEDLSKLQNQLETIRKQYREESEYIEIFIYPILESQSFEQEKDKILEELKATGGTFSESFNFSKDFVKQLQYAGITVEEFSEQIENIYTRAQDKLINLSGMTEDKVQEFLSGMSFEDIQLIGDSNFDVSTFEEFLRKLYELKAQNNSIVIDIEVAKDAGFEALETLQSGELLSQEQIASLQEKFAGIYDLSNLANMSMLEQAKTMTGAILNTLFPETAFKQTAEQIKNIKKELKELNNKETLTELEKAKKVELEVNLEQAKKDIESLAMEPLQLSVEIDRTLVDGLLAQATAIDKASSLISEGFTVEAKNVSELVKTMPELFRDATVDIKTGIVQLSQEVVNSVIESESLATQKTRESLLNQLQARVDYANNAIDSLYILSDAIENQTKEEIINNDDLKTEKINASKAIVRAKIAQAIEEKSESAKTASRAIQDEKKVTEASKEEGKTFTFNWTSAMKKWAEAAKNAALNIIGYQTDVSSGKEVLNERAVLLDPNSQISGFKSSSSEYTWDYDDAQIPNYDLLLEWANGNKSFREIFSQNGINDLQANGYSITLAEQINDLLGTSIDAKDILGKKSEDFIFNNYIAENSTATVTGDIGKSKSYWSKYLADLIENYIKLGKFDTSLNGLAESGKKDEKDKKEFKAEIERYHKILREIEAQEKALDKLSKQKDEAFGENKLKLIDEEIAGLQKLKELQNSLLSEAQGNLTSDIAALKEIFPEADIDIEKGVLNYDELMAKAKSQEEVDAIKQVEETIDKIKEANEALVDLDIQIRSMNYDKLNYKLELKLDIDDAVLKELDYYLNKYSDNFYKMAESLALMVGDNELGSNQIEGYRNILENYAILDSDSNPIGGWVADLTEKYKNNEISQADYIDGLQKVRDSIYEQLESLNELDKQMLHYYEDTLSTATAELDDHTDHLEHLTSVFDHYLSLMDILGKKKDYDSIGDFLGGKTETLRDRLEIAKEYLEVLESQKEKVKASLDSAINTGDDAAIEQYKKEWDAIVDETDAAQEKVLSLTEEWASTMKEVIENNMTKLSDTLEKTLTNGLGFEHLMDNFDKLNTQQEEYLTKTNQIYETNKLMRTAEIAMDETTNKASKQKLKNFIEETKGLQENTRLSEYELEIQQAKYDLLVAELALEEAKNAKSTVRLSRDSEGNFGYVYTADEDAINEAQQNYDDAENNLYNLSLEHQQEYTEKYLQASQQMYEELNQLHNDYINGLISEEEFEVRKQNLLTYYLGSEEYNKALEELNQKYRDGQISSEEEYNRLKGKLMDEYQGQTGILTEYSHLYNLAVQTDADATQDNWQTNYSEMTQNTEVWKEAVDTYLKDIEKETVNWKDISTKANEDVKGALEKSEKATENLTEESENLAEMIQDEVIDAIDSEIDSVRNLTEEYANQRQEIENLIDAYLKYLNTINQQISSASGFGSSSGDKKYNKDIDYTALANEYLASGGQIGDDTYNAIVEQRWNKIEGENLSKDYYEVDSEGFVNKHKELGIDSEYVQKDYLSDEQYDKWLKEVMGYDTGGYTGSWGPEGKLAFLHQKELVLNEDDTENLLQTISFIRDIVSMIDTQASMASLFNMSASTHVSAGNEVLEQTVTIHADFPNATNHSEIEEAFTNLVNVATQYAHRK